MCAWTPVFRRSLEAARIYKKGDKTLRKKEIDVIVPIKLSRGRVALQLPVNQ